MSRTRGHRIYHLRILEINDIDRFRWTREDWVVDDAPEGRTLDEDALEFKEISLLPGERIG